MITFPRGHRRISARPAATAVTVTCLAITGLLSTLLASPAQAAVAVQVSTVSSSFESGLTLRVQGTGFTAMTEPGDTGVNVALAESGQNLDAPDGQAAAVVFVSADEIQGGAFDVNITAPARRLDRSKNYSIYTFQAPDRSNPSQDSETPVNIDFNSLSAPTTPDVFATIGIRPRNQLTGRMLVRVVGTESVPQGIVNVKLVRNGVTRKQVSKALSRGRTRLVLPKLPDGRYQAKVVYRGSSDYTRARKVLLFRVD